MFQRSLLPLSSRQLITLMMEAARTSQTPGNFYQTAWHNNPEDSHLLSPSISLAILLILNRVCSCRTQNLFITSCLNQFFQNLINGSVVHISFSLTSLAPCTFNIFILSFRDITFFCPQSSTGFTSSTVHIASTHFSWVLQPLLFSLVHDI
jgi:hypothetical protein